MKNTRASERYAKSLLMLAIEKKILDKVKADVDLISKSFEDSREISNLYLSPITVSYTHLTLPTNSRV